MCSPGAALSIGGAVISGIGGSKQNAAQAQSMYAQAGQIIAQGAVNAQDLSNEATLHARQAALLRISGSYDAARATEKGEGLIATQAAGEASNGIALSGSIADMVRQTGESAGMDLGAMRFGAKANINNEALLASVYKKRAVTTLQLAGAEAADLVKGAKSVKNSAIFSFVSPIIAAGGTALNSSFA